MKQSKFSLADILTVLTAIAFGFICFLGKNFSTLGDISISVIWATFVAMSLASTALFAKLLKQTSRNFKTNFILEILVILLFTGLTAFFAYSLFPHYFNVSAKKEEIQRKLQASIKQAENMFDEYELHAQRCESAYHGSLNAAVNLENPSELKKYKFKDKSEVNYDIQIKHKMSTLHTYLFPNNYSDTINNNGIKEVAITWLNSAKQVTKSWKPIGVVNVVNNLEEKLENWKNQLVGFSQPVNIKEDEFPPFVYSLTFTDVKTHFTTLGKPTPLSISLTVGAYLLMLLSYFVSKRSSKSTIGSIKQRGEYDIDF